jgi:hypothetical protein
MEEYARIRWIHDMEAPQPPRSISNVLYSIVKYLAIYVREKSNNVSKAKSLLIVLICIV